MSSDEFDYYMTKASKYKQACGILRHRLSEFYDIVKDPDISNDEKVNILLAEMDILTNADEISYDYLDVYDEGYSFLLEHSEEYINYHSKSQEKGRQM